MANLVAKFKLEKQKEINAVFKIQKVVPADGIEEQLQAEINRATAKEQELQENINGLSSALDFETQARKTADTNINSAITLEIANRQNADNNLQSQIDTKQPIGDYATNSRVDVVVDAFDNEIETISNEIEDLIQNKADKSEIPDVSNFATNQRVTDVADELNQTIEENVVALQQQDTILQNQIILKQDKLISGENIKTINNQSIIGEGNIDIQGGGASSFAELEGDPYDNQALANVLNSLDIISLLAMYLKDSLGNQLLDSNGSRLILRRL